MIDPSRLLRLAWACLACAGVACGGVAQEQRVLDAGPEQNDAASLADASIENDAGAVDACPSETVSCCDKLSGMSSRPTCVDGYTQCGTGLTLQLADDECRRTPAVCRVASPKELDGKACSLPVTSCLFGGGCSSCLCECQESTLLWFCGCTPC
jgi:hypothetical protein